MFSDVQTILQAPPHSIHSAPYAHLLWVSHGAVQFATFLSCLFILLFPSLNYRLHAGRDLIHLVHGESSVVSLVPGIW